MLLDELPGFRRRFRITPGAGKIQCEVEDDFHCMSVVVHHDGTIVRGMEADMRRAPWTTCPGAEAKVRQTFVGEALADFGRRSDKRSNCTHLYDLALLAAAHANDDQPLVYDILVSDPLANERRAEVRRNGDCVLWWVEKGFVLQEPAGAAGLRLDKLKPWIASLAAELQEPAKLLQWGNMLANGRTIPLENQSDASKMPPSCYTFQPERKQVAKRVGEIKDFSEGSEQPLDKFEPAW
ncbi:DUF2889 domain-containing protein [Litorivivens sp.]|uniref:DUF2889 domain-containing protein n=2 Tax=Litorivivens sp. TaxID=2020868 RepID=UPI003566BC2B